MTGGRHRIIHGGHGQLNAAIYRTVIVRLRFHEPTIAYVAHWTAEGKSKRDIIRCLKRYEYATAGWVDWYINRRLHGSLWMLAPIEFETLYYQALTRGPEPAK